MPPANAGQNISVRRLVFLLRFPRTFEMLPYVAALRAKVQHIRDEFLYQIDVARNFERAIRSVAAKYPILDTGLKPNEVYRAVGLAFMGVCAAWEDFVEGAMIRYLVNARTTKGYSPVLRVGTCASLAHAYQVLSGKPHYDPDEHYMSWTNPVAVVRLAEVYFADGAPFKLPLLRETDRLKQSVKIRNRVAHASPNCKAQFKQAANVIRQRDKGKSLGKGFRVGELLSETAGPFFGSYAKADAAIFEAYMSMFETIASEIVPD